MTSPNPIGEKFDKEAQDLANKYCGSAGCFIDENGKVSIDHSNVYDSCEAISDFIQALEQAYAEGRKAKLREEIGFVITEIRAGMSLTPHPDSRAWNDAHERAINICESYKNGEGLFQLSAQEKEGG